MAVKDKQRQLLTTARFAGIWYLVIAISGVLGFMVFHPKVFIAGDPEKTLGNLTNLESIARVRLLLEFTIIVSQALAAVWFYRLFKGVNEWASWAIGIWGMMNSAAIMISAISMGSAIEIANAPAQAHESKVLLIQLLSSIISNAWGVGGIFFGLWLIPMGYVVTSSKRMPVWLGRTLIIGGIGYLLSAFLKYGGIENSYLDLFVLPATIGEFWMIGYLLIYGIHPLKEQ